MATARDDADLLTTAEAARRLRVHRSTVWKLVRSSRLPAVWLTPRILRIPRAAVESLATRGGAGGLGTRLVGGGHGEVDEDPLVVALRSFREKLLAKRGGRTLSDSTQILRELRSQRATR